MPNTATAMKPLYDRLKPYGLNQKYIRTAVLPDWWDDTLSADESNRLYAEMRIARFLDIPLQTLRDTSTAELPIVHNDVRLKRRRDTEVNKVTGAIAVASHLARVTAKLVEDRLPFTGGQPALEIRRQLLERPDCTWPDLANLVDYCWNQGIAVVHATHLPRITRKIDGLATFIGERPVIVLASQRKSPAWLAFHLAHELGHIMCGHVKPHEGPLVDVDIQSTSSETQEQEADEYAFQVLTGWPRLELCGAQGLQAAAFARKVEQFGARHRIYPGTVALIYGYCQNRIPLAQKALNAMGENEGAHETLAQAFRTHVPLDNLPDSFQRSLAAMTQVLGITAVAG